MHRPRSLEGWIVSSYSLPGELSLLYLHAQTCEMRKKKHSQARLAIFSVEWDVSEQARQHSNRKALWLMSAVAAAPQEADVLPTERAHMHPLI